MWARTGLIAPPNAEGIRVSGEAMTLRSSPGAGSNDGRTAHARASYLSQPGAWKCTDAGGIAWRRRPA